MLGTAAIAFALAAVVLVPGCRQPEPWHEDQDLASIERALDNSSADVSEAATHAHLERILDRLQGGGGDSQV